jgi:hypothetical protein
MGFPKNGRLPMRSISVERLIAKERPWRSMKKCTSTVRTMFVLLSEDGRQPAAKTHARVEWNAANGTYLLDPTFNWSACSSAQQRNSSYIPLYADAGSRKYRAASATLLAKN